MQSWIEGSLLEGDPRAEAITLPDGLTWDDVALAASEILFEQSGCRYPGSHETTIRPHRTVATHDCRGFGWYDDVSAGPIGFGQPSCSNMYLLPGAPVTAIGEVLVDGDALDPAAYSLYGRRMLVRMQDTNGVALPWPCFQRLEVPATEKGTWQVTYTHGAVPPQMGILAAKELGFELGLLFSGEKNRLPQRVQSVQRSGVTVQVAESVSLLKDGKLGFYIADAFIGTANPNRLRRRPIVLSPDAMTATVVTP